MNLYRISQTVNNGYDTFSDAVVCAHNEEAARHMHPRNCENTEDEWHGCWAKPSDVEVELIGKAEDHVSIGVVCSSYHAG